MTDSTITNKPLPSVKKNKKKKSKKKKVIFGIIIGVVLLIIITIIISSNKEKEILVQTEKITKRNITQVVTATGKIQSETQVNISAEISGEIVSLPFKEGEEVKKGDLLVKINPDAYYPQLKQQTAGVRVQQRNLESQEVTLQKYELELKRIQELYDKGLASQSELDNTQATVNEMLAQMNTTRAQINQQRASLLSVKYDLSKTTINSPISGTVTQLNNELGEKVLGTSFNVGSTIMAISDLSKMECQVEVGETDVSFVKIGDTARIEVDAFPDKILTGYVYEVANSATTTGIGTQDEVVNFIIKVRILDKDIELRPGMSCTADIEVNRKENVIAVPIQSVTVREEGFGMFGDETEGEDEEDKPENLSRESDDKMKKKKKPQEIVFIVENNYSVKKNVKSGISDDFYVEITEGLKEGEEVIKGPFKAINKELEEDTKVKVDNTKRKRFRRDE
ncbi:MAG: efflux RND transporter periplasmic adaptor subunit [Ignavibacteria bacterium]|nr:efflux RND transporter periplasmic adaptor subunit [Ignavibacteria bacterium]